MMILIKLKDDYVIWRMLCHEKRVEIVGKLMTEEEVSKYRSRVILIIGSLSAGMLVFALIADFLRTPDSLERFKVVDTYEGCDIIRWYDSQHTAEFKYFMRCK